jgi:hypothetical protein
MMRKLSFVALGVCTVAALAATPCIAQIQTENTLKEPIGPVARELAQSEPEETTPLHFVVDLNLNNMYYTPRGLVVQRTGASFHLLALGILDLYKNSKGPVTTVSVTAGAWNNFQTSFDRSPYNEVDPIIGVEATFYKNWIAGATFVPFISPPNLFPGGTEFNFEFKLAYDDTDLLGAFAVHPYIKPFWHFSGPSPVVLGQDDAWDFETGINPSVKLFQESDTPLNINFPLFAAWGGKAWYGGAGTFLGHVSQGILFTLPLSKFISPDNGFWSLYAGYAYSRIVNDNLFEGGNIVSGNDKRDINLFTGGVNFFMP